MKRILLLASGLCLSLGVTSTTFAQGSGPGYGTPGPTNTGQTGAGTMGTMRMGQTGTTSTGMGATTGSQGTMGMGQRLGTLYSPANRAPVVPSGAIEAGRTAMGASTMTTYSMGGRLYHVMYAPNGTYTYTVTGPSGVMSSSGGSTVPSSSVAGTTVNTAGRSVAGVTVMPRTGGGGAPAPGLPVLPVLISFTVIGIGAFARRIALLQKR
ncbi:MAG: hypothetical protein ACR2JC_14180 [Chloroflexota bacterium]|nr:MAG: hypothetical protein DLM70_18705 [Chloroflexota bacterium]